MNKLLKFTLLIILLLIIEYIYLNLYLDRIENIENNERGVVDVRR